MEFPTVETTKLDRTTGVTYTVLAYRRVTDQEFLEAMAAYLARRKTKPKRGQHIKVLTIIGAGD